jgi:hypothetical protein
VGAIRLNPDHTSDLPTGEKASWAGGSERFDLCVDSACVVCTPAQALNARFDGGADAVTDAGLPFNAPCTLSSECASKCCDYTAGDDSRSCSDPVDSGLRLNCTCASNVDCRGATTCGRIDSGTALKICK